MLIDNKWHNLKFSFTQKRHSSWKFCLPAFLICCVFAFAVLKQEITASVVFYVRSVVYEMQFYIVTLKETLCVYPQLFEKNRNVQQEVLDLKQENLKLKVELARMVQLIDNNEEIAALKAKSEQYSKTIIGKVISITQNDYNEFAIIDIGQKDGVEKDDFVINECGLVGRVTQLENTWSVVTLITDKTLYIPIKFKSQNGMAIARGTNTGCLRIAKQKEPFKITSNDVVVTSGYGGLFHEGIIVGTVSSDGEILPSVDMKRIRFICVVGHIPY